MDDSEYLNSSELRILTGKGSSFLQIEMLNKHKIPHCLDEYGTPLVRFKDLSELSDSFEAKALTNQILERFRSR